MAGKDLSFSKVVATPTTNAWSQAYSAGSLFAAISLQSDVIPQEDENLNSLGKDVISTLESEFFPLEIKSLETIKGAIDTTISKVKEDIKLSFVVCYLNDNILYLYAAGGGKAILKREEKIGTVIDSDSSREIKLASGYVQDKDYIVLQTEPFLKTVAAPTMASALDKPSPEDVSEELAPHVHEKSEGGASAIILSYNINSSGIATNNEEASSSSAVASGVAATATIAQTEKTEEESEKLNEKPEQTSPNPETIPTDNKEDLAMNQGVSPQPAQQKAEEETLGNLTEEKSESQTSPYLTDQKSRRRMPGIGLGRLRRISRRRLFVLIGIILIVIILLAGLYFFLNKGSSSNQALFDQVYNEANAKFEECQSLQELNESLAEEKCKEAQQILVQNQNTFPQGSDEANQINSLLTQVNNTLGNTGGGGEATTTATEVDKSESQILSVEIDNPNSEYFTQNEDFIYFITAKGVTKLDKGNSQEEEIIDKSWEEAGGIGTFGSNVYVLDKTSNILKFVPSGDSFSSSDYLTGDVSLENSQAMTIDGSVYVLDSNGNINKFTRGAEDDFSISGLEKPMTTPTRIVTGEDFENIYILDKGNSRIVVINKDGDFIKAYSADILKNARDIDPQEADGAIFVLSNDKVYKIDIE